MMQVSKANALNVYAVCELSADGKTLIHVTAVTFAENPGEAEARVRQLYPDARRVPLYVLPAFHQHSKQLLEAEGLSVTRAIAEFARLESDLLLETARERMRRRARGRKRKERIAVAGPKPAAQAAPAPSVQAGPVPAAQAPIEAPAEETLDRADVTAALVAAEQGRKRGRKPRAEKAAAALVGKTAVRDVLESVAEREAAKGNAVAKAVVAERRKRKAAAAKERLAVKAARKKA